MSGVVLAVLLALSAPQTHAAGFGEVQVASQLGERLYARVPLVGDGAADVAPECVKLIPESALQDAPALSNARVAIDRRSSPPAVVVSTPAAVNEPAVRFVLELGCGNRLRREFVLLIDPPDLPAVQTAAQPVVPPAARVVPRDESRWGASASGDTAAPTQAAATQPLFDAPLAEPAVQPAPTPRKAAPKPRPKPAAKRQVAQAQPQPASAPPPPVRAPEAPKPAGTDRLVLTDSEPASQTTEQATRDAAAEQAAKNAAREEALTRQIEALTKEVARMREDMDKLAARNRELTKEAENSRTGWFAAAGLGIALAGVGLGLLGRREKKKTWRENLSTADEESDELAAPLGAALPQVHEEAPAAAPKARAAAVVAPAALTGFHTTSHDISDLDITKIDVQESVGGGTLMPVGAPAPATTVGSVTTMFPSDLTAGTALAEAAKTQMGPLKELDFSLDDIDLKVPTVVPKSPIFSPTSQVSPDESEAARAKLFEEIEQAHRASKKG